MHLRMYNCLRFNVDIKSDVYKGSFLQVICGKKLPKPIPLIKTGVECC